MNLFLASLVMPLLAAAGAAPGDPAAPPTSPAAPSGPSAQAAPPAHVAIVTEKGTITLALDRAHAPVTTGNFLKYVDQKRFDGTVFYRVMRLPWGERPNGLIQGGTRGDPNRTLAPIAHEATSQTGILHKAGAISMARFAPGTAAGDFSILLSDIAGLDADPASPDPDRRAGFAAFGYVVSGMDVVRAIFDAPLSPTKGEGVMKGQMLEPEVRIVSVRRAPPPASPHKDAPRAAPLP